MTSIRSFSEILLSTENVSEEEQNKFLAIIHDESQRLTRLLDQILDIGRLEASSLDLPLAPVDPEVVIQAALDSVSGMIRGNNVIVNCSPIAKPVWVHANEDRLRQVLINLLSNAIKYNDAISPEIVVRSDIQQNFVNIEIVDNGGGVNREEAATVFEKFRRGRRSELDEGAGLGLPISRAIMRTMEGDLTVEFADNATSFFRVHLVRAPVPSPEPELTAALSQ